MVEPLRHRQTKEAETDIFDLKPPRHTSTLPKTGGFPVSTATLARWDCGKADSVTVFDQIIYSETN